MRTIEVSSTSIDKAKEKGLMLLDTTEENVFVKVLEENSTLKKFKIPHKELALSWNKFAQRKNKDFEPKVKSDVRDEPALILQTKFLKPRFPSSAAADAPTSFSTTPA